MKKFLIPVLAIIAAGCSKYDNSALLQRMSSIEERVNTLKETLETMNQDAAAMTALVEAYKNGKTVSGVAPKFEKDVLLGYDVTLTDGSSFMIRNGMNGKDGYSGRDGVDGHTPVIGVMPVDGQYFWTVDGNLMLDGSGNRIPASPDPSSSKVKDGQTPVISIADGKWIVTVGGTSYEAGTVADTDNLVVDRVFLSVSGTDSEVTFSLRGGTVISLPKEAAYSVALTVAGTYEVTYSVTGGTSASTVDVVCEKGWSAAVSATSGSAGKIIVSPETEPVDAAFMVLCSDGVHNAASSFRITGGTITVL